jgi:transcriptional regulator with XRE-family HTH domain
MLIGKNLKRARQSVKMTQAEFAQALNVDTATVSRWERDLAIPRLHTIKEIGDLTGIPADRLYRTR